MIQPPHGLTSTLCDSSPLPTAYITPVPGTTDYQIGTFSKFLPGVAPRLGAGEITGHGNGFDSSPTLSPPRPSEPMSSQADPESSSEDRRRVAPAVALALLEVIRDQDLPREVLADEDLTLTLPRRLGLSDVIDAQIRRYREEAKRRRRVSDAAIRDLVRLVVRRPDSEDVFRLVGVRLADVGTAGPGWRAALPRRVAMALARRQARRRLKALFGRRVGQFRKGPFVLEGRNLLFIRSDPGGDACLLLSGLLSAVLHKYLGDGLSVAHTKCQARKDEACRWEATEHASARPEARVADETRHEVA